MGEATSVVSIREGACRSAPRMLITMLRRLQRNAAIARPRKARSPLIGHILLKGNLQGVFCSEINWRLIFAPELAAQFPHFGEIRRLISAPPFIRETSFVTETIATFIATPITNPAAISTAISKAAISSYLMTIIAFQSHCSLLTRLFASSSNL